jgi:16S rRNA (guanine966-N2)-methyltransferase
LSTESRTHGGPAGGGRAGGKHARGTHARELRIIAGDWRGRRWRFPDADIRPTPDRVRETLFNWLQTHIRGARCLDLYAGSGALGLEALSRGARQVVFVDHSRVVTLALRAVLQQWIEDATDRAARAEVVCAPARRYIDGPARAFDLIFLDPPYAAGELDAVAAALDRGWLEAGGWIYVEHAARAAWAPPASWREIRAGNAGSVGYHLFEREAISR